MVQVGNLVAFSLVLFLGSAYFRFVYQFSNMGLEENDKRDVYHDHYNHNSVDHPAVSVSCMDLQLVKKFRKADRERFEEID